MATTESERLLLLCNELYNGNQANFARVVGIGNTAINKIIHGKASEIGLRLTPNYINRICKALPQVSRSWLESGEGYPGDISVDFVRGRYEKIIHEKDVMIAELTKQLSVQRKMIEKLL